jgi:hypothetical protein
LPQVKQLSPTFEVLSHFQAKTFFEVSFPSRVIRIGCPFDFGVSLDRHIGDVEQMDLAGFSLFVLDFAAENPFAVSNGVKIFLVLSDYPCVPQDIVVPHGKKSGKQSITFKVKEKALKEMVEIK